MATLGALECLLMSCVFRTAYLVAQYAVNQRLKLYGTLSNSITLFPVCLLANLLVRLGNGLQLSTDVFLIFNVICVMILSVCGGSVYNLLETDWRPQLNTAR